MHDIAAGVPIAVSDNVQPPALRTLIKDMTSIEASGRPRLPAVQKRLAGIINSLYARGESPQFLTPLHNITCPILPRQVSGKANMVVTTPVPQAGAPTDTMASVPPSPETVPQDSKDAGATVSSTSWMQRKFYALVCSHDLGLCG